eukprot:9449291-Pyramimonas_sp.AAC.1
MLRSREVGLAHRISARHRKDAIIGHSRCPRVVGSTFGYIPSIFPPTSCDWFVRYPGYLLAEGAACLAASGLNPERHSSSDRTTCVPAESWPPHPPKPTTPHPFRELLARHGQ